MGHPTMQENDTAKLTPTPMGDIYSFFIICLIIFEAKNRNRCNKSPLPKKKCDQNNMNCFRILIILPGEEIK